MPLVSSIPDCGSGKMYYFIYFGKKSKKSMIFIGDLNREKIA